MEVLVRRERHELAVAGFAGQRGAPHQQRRRRSVLETAVTVGREQALEQVARVRQRPAEHRLRLRDDRAQVGGEPRGDGDRTKAVEHGFVRHAIDVEGQPLLQRGDERRRVHRGVEVAGEQGRRAWSDGCPRQRARHLPLRRMLDVQAG